MIEDALSVQALNAFGLGPGFWTWEVSGRLLFLWQLEPSSRRIQSGVRLTAAGLTSIWASGNGGAKSLELAFSAFCVCTGRTA